MNLFNLPYLALKEVLNHLSINHVLFLSLCSKKTKNSIIQIQKWQLKKVERLNYLIIGKKVSIDVKMVYDCEETTNTMMKLFDIESDFPEYEDGDSVEEVRVNELGTSFVRSSTNTSDLHAKYCSENLQSTIETIHNQLYDLFGQHTKFWLTSTFQKTCFLPMLRNIQVVEVYGYDFESTRIDEFLSKCTCLQSFSLGLSYNQDIELRRNSNIFELDNVHVWRCRSLATDVLKYFNGRHAFLAGYSNVVTTKNVIRFLNEWRTGEKFRNLEVISMDSNFDVRDIRNSVELKEVNTEVVYSFATTEFPEPCLTLLDHGEFTSHSYMVRESDGLVASVMLEHYIVFVGVWNLTEHEFLEKFQ